MHYDYEASELVAVAPLREISRAKQYGGVRYELVGAAHTIRLFLRRVLHSGDDHASSNKRDLFSTIPTEIRLMILEVVLVVPQSRVMVNFRKHNSTTYVKVVHAKSKEICERSSPFPSGVCYRFHPEVISEKRSADALAILGVNKQIYQEAMPIFYGKNVFACEYVGELTGLILNTPSARRNHIRHVKFQYKTWSCDTKCVSQCFKIMKDMESLRRLDIEIEEERPCPAKMTAASNPLKLPGLRDLASLRVREVNIYGDCPTYRARLEQMVKVEAEEEAKKPDRKRKVKNVSPKA
jgi:hypothetical protein